MVLLLVIIANLDEWRLCKITHSKNNNIHWLLCTFMLAVTSCGLQIHVHVIHTYMYNYI